MTLRMSRSRVGSPLSSMEVRMTPPSRSKSLAGLPNTLRRSGYFLPMS
jgi:hypothetical protein